MIKTAGAKILLKIVALHIVFLIVVSSATPSFAVDNRYERVQDLEMEEQEGFHKESLTHCHLLQVIA